MTLKQKRQNQVWSRSDAKVTHAHSSMTNKSSVWYSVQYSGRRYGVPSGTFQVLLTEKEIAEQACRRPRAKETATATAVRGSTASTASTTSTASTATRYGHKPPEGAFPKRWRLELFRSTYLTSSVPYSVSTAYLGVQQYFYCSSSTP